MTLYTRPFFLLSDFTLSTKAAEFPDGGGYRWPTAHATLMDLIKIGRLFYTRVTFHCLHVPCAFKSPWSNGAKLSYPRFGDLAIGALREAFPSLLGLELEGIHMASP